MRRRLQLAPVVAVLLAASVFALVASEDLNIFIIPHSHCDPGWLKTFEEYYRQDVSRVLDNVMRALAVDESRKFNWAEISFFSRWYEEQPLTTRETLQKYIDEGRFEFIEAGWVQNDEANAHYDAVIRQITEGHEYVMKNFGVRPRIAWQIDPFGHSALTPTLMARMGFDGLVINRILWATKDEFKRKQHMEFVWQASPSLGQSAEIFTHVLHTHYSAPKGFDWEEGAWTVTDGNVKTRARDLVNECKKRASAYRTPNLLVPFGDDFKFKNAESQFANMGKIIAEINANTPGVNIKFATVSEYFDAVHAAEKEFPLYLGDFFPYADNGNSWWTGYYTTRPALKTLSRTSDGLLRAAEIAHTLARASYGDAQNWDGSMAALTKARRDTSLVQHHDGITGTAKAHVVSDYTSRLESADAGCWDVLKQSAELLLAVDTSRPRTLSTINTVIDVTDGGVPLVLQNSLAWERREYVRVKVNEPTVTVVDAEGNAVVAQVQPAWDEVPGTGEPLPNTYTLLIPVSVPPLGYTTYFLLGGDDQPTTTHVADVTVYGSSGAGGAGGVRGGGEQNVGGVKYVQDSPATVSVSTAALEVTITNGVLASVTDKASGTIHRVEQEFLHYRSAGSGAYMFTPAGAADSYTPKTDALRVIQGPLGAEIQVSYGAILSTFRIYNGGGDHEMDGRIETHFNVAVDGDRELVVRYHTDLATGNVFWTGNSQEMQRRLYHKDKKLASNYYPMISSAFLRGADGNQLTAVTHTARGVTSLEQGTLEMMLHRQLLRDDGRGLAEPNRDRSRVTTSMWLSFGGATAQEAARPRWALMIDNPVHALVGPPAPAATLAPAVYGESYVPTFMPLSSPFPRNTHLLTLAVRDGVSDDVVFRAYHLYSAIPYADGLESLIAPVELPVSSLMSFYDFGSVRETSLALAAGLGSDNLNSVRLQYSNIGEIELDRDPALLAQDPTDNQNAGEAGVFLSKAALEAARKQKEKEEAERRAREEEKDAAAADAAAADAAAQRDALAAQQNAAELQAQQAALERQQAAAAAANAAAANNAAINNNNNVNGAVGGGAGDDSLMEGLLRLKREQEQREQLAILMSLDEKRKQMPVAEQPADEELQQLALMLWRQNKEAEQQQAQQLQLQPQQQQQQVGGSLGGGLGLGGAGGMTPEQMRAFAQQQQQQQQRQPQLGGGGFAGAGVGAGGAGGFGGGLGGVGDADLDARIQARLDAALGAKQLPFGSPGGRALSSSQDQLRDMLANVNANANANANANNNNNGEGGEKGDVVRLHEAANARAKYFTDPLPQRVAPGSEMAMPNSPLAAMAANMPPSQLSAVLNDPAMQDIADRLRANDFVMNKFRDERAIEALAAEKPDWVDLNKGNGRSLLAAGGASAGGFFSISLNPMDIKTYVLTLSRKSGAPALVNEPAAVQGAVDFVPNPLLDQVKNALGNVNNNNNGGGGGGVGGGFGAGGMPNNNPLDPKPIVKLPLVGEDEAANKAGDFGVDVDAAAAGAEIGGEGPAGSGDSANSGDANPNGDLRAQAADAAAGSQAKSTASGGSASSGAVSPTMMAVLSLGCVVGVVVLLRNRSPGSKKARSGRTD